MKQPYWKPQHEVFIHHMLLLQDSTKAYRAAYPKASKTSARVGGIRLNNYPHISERIQPILAQRRAEADLLAMQQSRERTRQQTARCHHIRSIIGAIARKEIKKDRHFIVNGETITLQEDISHAALLHLVSLDLKLAGGYNNWPAIERQFTKFTHNTSPVRTAISCDGRNEALIFRQQTVTNSRPNSIPETITAIHAKTEIHAKTGNRTTCDNILQGLERYFDTSLHNYLTYKETLVNDRTFHVKKQ